MKNVFNYIDIILMMGKRSLTYWEIIKEYEKSCIAFAGYIRKNMNII